MDEACIWVTGVGGVIGSEVLRMAPQFSNNTRVRGWLHGELELTDRAAVREAFRRSRPEAIIHCAALSRNPQCHADPELARRVNVDATAYLASLAKDVPLLFFSTDLVFDGRKGHYRESDPVNPLSVYAETKVAAEQIVLENPLHTVIRNALTAGRSPTGNRSFNEEMRLAWEAGKVLNLFSDEFRCPIGSEVIARAVWELLRANRPGLYHLAGTERLSRFEIGQALVARRPEFSHLVRSGSVKDYHGPPRPVDASLDCSLLQTLLSFTLPRFTDWLTSHPELSL